MKVTRKSIGNGAKELWRKHGKKIVVGGLAVGGAALLAVFSRHKEEPEAHYEDECDWEVPDLLERAMGEDFEWEKEDIDRYNIVREAADRLPVLDEFEHWEIDNINGRNVVIHRAADEFDYSDYVGED